MDLARGDVSAQDHATDQPGRDLGLAGEDESALLGQVGDAEGNQLRLQGGGAGVDLVLIGNHRHHGHVGRQSVDVGLGELFVAWGRRQ